MSIEEALRAAIDRLALVRVTADLLARHPHESDARSFSGLADVCEDISTLACGIRRTLSVETLDLEVRPSRQR